MTCFIDLNLFYTIIEIFNIKSLVTSIIPKLFWFVKNFTFDNSTYNVYKLLLYILSIDVYLNYYTKETGIGVPIKQKRQIAAEVIHFQVTIHLVHVLGL